MKFKLDQHVFKSMLMTSEMGGFGIVKVSTITPRKGLALRVLRLGLASNQWLRPAIYVRTEVMASLAVTCLQLAFEPLTDLPMDNDWDGEREVNAAHIALKTFVTRFCRGGNHEIIELDESWLTRYLKELREVGAKDAL